MKEKFEINKKLFQVVNSHFSYRELKEESLDKKEFEKRMFAD